MANNLPTLANLIAAANAGGPRSGGNKSGWLVPGVSAGIDQFQALSGRGLQAVGDLLGSQTVSDLGADIAERNWQEAARSGRADLESFPTDDWSKAPAWLGYQVAKQLPTLALTALAYKAGGKFAAAAVPEEVAALGAAAPKWLGGGGLRAGMTAAEVAAAKAQGAKMVAGVLTQAPVNYPQAVGSMYDEAVQSGNQGRGAAAAALLGGVPYSLAEGFEPATLGKALERGMTKGVLKRIATGAAVNAAQETMTEGVQTAMEQAFRPDLPVRERLANVVEGAITGGVVGGVFGGFSGAIGGMREVKTENPAAVTDDKLKETIDQALKPEANSAGQFEMPGLDERQRPATGAQNFMGGAEPAPVIPASRVNITNFPLKPAGEEFEGFVQGPFRSEAGVVPPPAPAPERQGVDERRAYPSSSVGTARWQRYQDIGNQYGYEVAQRAAEQMGDVQADTSARPTNPDQGVFDLRANGQVLAEQASPARVAGILDRFAAGEETQQDRELAKRLNLEIPSTTETAETEAVKEDPELAKKTSALLGGTNSNWQKNVLAQPAKDYTDRVSQVYEQIGMFVDNGLEIPKTLVKAGQKIGMLDQNGEMQDWDAVGQQLEARAEKLFERANLTGKGLGEANAALKQAKAWRDQVKTLNEASARLRARFEASEQALDASAQAAAQQQAAVSEDQRPSTIEESAAVLAGAPPPPSPLSFNQRFQQRGVAPVAGQALSEAPAPVVTQQSKAQARKATREAAVLAAQQEAAARDASGTQYQNLDQRLRGQVPRVAGVAPTQVDPQARAAAALGLTVPPAAVEPDMQVLTAQDAAAKRRLQRQRRKQREAAARERVVPPPAPVQSPLAAGTSVGAVNARAAAAIEEQRQQVLKRLDAVANDVSLDEVGQQGLRQKAVAAAQAYAAGAQGSDKAAYKVLAEHGKATGGTVFSSRPTSERTPPMSDQAFDQELTRIAKKLPRVAREAIIPVDTAAQLPPEVLEAARLQGMHPSEIRGVLHEGKVYVVAENVSSAADLQEVIAHEVFGHGGARALLGDQRAAILTRIWDMVGGLEGLRALARSFGVEAQLNQYLPGRDFTAADKVNLTDELLAQVAGKTSGKWKTFLMAWASRFKSALINTLNAIGLQTAAERLNTFTPVDMAEMIVRMREAVLSGKTISGKEPAFSKNQKFVYVVHGGSNFDTIDLSNSGRGEPGNIRPLGPGLYGYVVDPNNPEMARKAIKGAQMYGNKYGRGEKTLHMFKVPMSANVSSVGKTAIEGMGLSPDARAKWDTEFETLKRLSPDALNRALGVDAKMEKLPGGLVEFSILNPDAAVRVSKHPIDASTETVLDAISSDSGPSFLRMTPQGMNESLQNIFKSADNFKGMVDRARQSETRLKLNEFHLYTSTISHIVSSFGKLFETKDASGNPVNPLRNFWDALVMRGVAEQRMAHAVANSYSRFDALLSSNPDAERVMNTLMQYTFDTIAPFKSWADHTWLHSNDPATNARNKAKVEAANSLYRKLNEGNNESGKKILESYHDFINSNEGMHFAQQAMSLYNLMSSDKEIAQSLKDEMVAKNPMDEFLQATDTYDNTKASRDYWEAKTKLLVEKAESYLKAQNELANTLDKTSAEKIEKNTSSLKARLRSIAAEQMSMKQAPYFHLGRFGDWVLTFSVRMKDGKADPAAMDAIAQRFKDAGIDGIEIPKDATRSNAFIRFESKAERDAAQKIAHELAAKGFVIHNGDKKINAFNRADDTAMRAFDISTMPQWAQGLMDRIRAKEFGKIEGLSDADKKLVARLNSEFERHVEQYFLDLLPDTSMTKVMVHRNNVPGFSADMMRSQLFRSQVAGRALANLYAAGRMADARASMLEQSFEARSDLDTTRSQMKQNVVSELFLRESQRPHIEKNTWIDVARAVNHAYFLGMTPAYPVVNLTQIGVLLWPELSKRFGFVNSAKAIAKVTPTALKVLRAVWSEARKSGWRNLPDASINTQVLTAAGLSGPQANFIMRIVNSGILDIGSQSREIGRIVEGQRFSKLDNGLRWAASFGYYSEMLSRLVAALSARELHGGTGDEMYRYVDDTVRQSMLSYETWNQARATGKMGLAGQYTPIMTSLMQYTFQLTEKLYREFHDGFMDSTLSADEKAAARRFLGAHLAAIVTLTGTLGMPMANVFAGVFDALANTVWKDDDDEPMNIRVAYRNWLADVFGDTVGDMIARGVPRAGGYGVDLSARAGEQDLLPYAHMFSKLLTDKREWKDKVAEDTFRTLGAPVSMANNIISGGSQLMNGNYMDGLIEMMPPAIKGPMKAAKLVSDGGYTDAKGNRIPTMTPGTTDILAQALGFNPANNAEYQESKNDQRVLQGAMINKASQIRESIATAYEQGDREAMRQYMLEAEAFDAKNPEFRILKRIGQVLRSRAKERETSRVSGAPLGVKPGLADRTRYGIAPD